VVGIRGHGGVGMRLLGTLATVGAWWWEPVLLGAFLFPGPPFKQLVVPWVHPKLQRGGRLSVRRIDSKKKKTGMKPGSFTPLSATITPATCHSTCFNVARSCISTAQNTCEIEQDTHNSIQADHTRISCCG